jgi:uncharacterized protein YukE
MKYSRKNKIYKMTKRNYPNRPNLRKMSKHGGGLIGWIKHKIDMYRFNSFVEKFATTKKELKSEYESFNAETDFYERDALRKAELVSDYLIQSKVNTILKLQDLSTPPFDTSPILKRGVLKDKKISAKKIKEIQNRIRRLNKEHKDNKGEYKRMNKKFNKNIDRFERVMDSHTNLAGFLEKVDSLYKKYSRIKGKDKAKLSKKHQNLIKRFESHHENFKKVHAFTDSYMDKTNKFVNAYTDLRRRAEFASDQFDKTKMSNFDSDIEKWTKEIEKFYDALMDCNEKGKEFSKVYETNIKRVRNVHNRLHTVGGDSDEVVKQKKYLRNINELFKKCLSHQNDINDLIEKLKINFLKNEPAIRIQYESGLVFAKAYLIQKMLKEIEGYLPKIGVPKSP